MMTQRRHDFARRKLAGRVGGLLLASALLPFVGLATAQAADVSPDDSRALLVTGNVNACPSGTSELGSGDYESTATAKELTITAVDAGTTVTHIYVKGGPDAHLYEPGKRGLTVNPPWAGLFSPNNGGENMPDISHVIVCGVKTTETTSSGTTTSSSTASSSTTAPSTTTTAPATTTTTTAPGTTTTTTALSTTTTPPSATTTTDVEVSGTRTTAPASTTTTTAAGTTTTPAAVLGVKITGGRSDVVASRQAARQLAYTGSQTWLAAGTSAVLLLAGIALIVASGSFRRPNRKH